MVAKLAKHANLSMQQDDGRRIGRVCAYGEAVALRIGWAREAATDWRRRGPAMVV
jgi:hypothetical protein